MDDFDAINLKSMPLSSSGGELNGQQKKQLNSKQLSHVAIKHRITRSLANMSKTNENRGASAVQQVCSRGGVQEIRRRLFAQPRGQSARALDYGTYQKYATCIAELGEFNQISVYNRFCEFNSKGEAIESFLPKNTPPARAWTLAKVSLRSLKRDLRRKQGRSSHSSQYIYSIHSLSVVFIYIFYPFFCCRHSAEKGRHSCRRRQHRSRQQAFASQPCVLQQRMTR